MKKLGLLCLAVVLALGSLGAGFAYWQETLEIGENPVNTGNVDWGFFKAYSNDADALNDPYFSSIIGGQPIYQRHDRDVAKSTVEPSGDLDPSTVKSVTVTIENAYPGYFPVVGLKMRHSAASTIPVKCKDVEVTTTGPADKIDLWVYGWRKWDNGNSGIVCSYNWIAINDFDEWLEGYLGNHLFYPGVDYLSFGDEEDESSLYLLVKDDMPENATVTFTITMTFTQFNAS